MAKASKRTAKQAARFTGKALRYAGFWPRVGAWFIDNLLYMVLAFLTLGMMSLGSLAGIAINFYLLKTEGYTVGKKMLGLKVLKADKSELSLVDILIRELIAKNIGAALFVAGLPLILLFGFGLLLIAAGALFCLAELYLLVADSKKQTLHDRIAKTVVVLSE